MFNKKEEFSFWQRLRFAWAAFSLEPIEIVSPFRDKTDHFYITVDCDNKMYDCCHYGKVATRAFYQKYFRIQTGWENAYFVCNGCATITDGKMFKAKENEID